MLREEQIDRAAQLLRTARLQNITLPDLPPDCRPHSIADAYAICDQLAELLGWDVGGWFCACTNEAIQTMLGLDEPYYARLFEDLLHASPARLRAGDFPPIIIECEFAFTLARDLPARDEPYTREEVGEAVAKVHPAIEVVAGHLENWPEQDVFSVIADNGTDGGLVYGEGVDWTPELDLGAVKVTLSANGAVVREGTGARVLGNPFDAFVWLANARSRDGDGLRAGHIHNTGTATDIYPVEGAVKLVADFGGIGAAELEIS